MALFSNPRELNLILDISSGSVGGALVLKGGKTGPFIIGTHRKNFPLRPDFNSLRIKKEMLEGVDVVCQELQRKTLRRPDKIFCILATPWSHGELRSIYYETKTDFKFTQKLAKRLVDEEVDRFKQEWANLKQVIDKRTTKVALNGYVVDKPNGESARTLRLDVFLSLAPEQAVLDIEEKIHKTFKARTAFTSQMFSDFVVVRDVFDLQNDFIILDVGEEVSEVTLMKDDHLVGTAFFPYGTASIMRFIAEKLGRSVHETKSLFYMHQSGHIDPLSNKNFVEAVKEAGSQWVGELKTILYNFSPNRHLPHNIFLNSDEKTDEWLGSHLGRVFFPEFTTSHTDFSVIIGSNKVLHGFASFAEGVVRDPALTMKAIFINYL